MRSPPVLGVVLVLDDRQGFGARQKGEEGAAPAVLVRRGEGRQEGIGGAPLEGRGGG